jgi:PAS domain S-box-containing protein
MRMIDWNRESQNVNPLNVGLNDFYQMAVESSFDAMAISEGGQLIFVNPKFLKIFGYEDIEEVLRMEKYFWIHPEYKSEFSNLEEAIQSNGDKTSAHIFKGLKRDGFPIPIEVGVAKCSRNGRDFVVFNIRDITGRACIENELKTELEELEIRLQALMDAAPIAYFWADLDGNVLYVNRCFEEFFGYTIKDFSKMDEWRRLAYPDEQYRELISSPDVRMHDKVKRPKEAWVACKDGTSRYMSRGRTSAGNRIMITYMDMTEWAQTKSELEASQTQLAEAIHLANAAPWSFDPMTLKYAFNDAYYALYGTSAEPQRGYQVSLEDFPMRFIHPDDRPAFYKAIQENANKAFFPDIMQVEEHALRSDGKDMYVLCRMRVYKDSHGRSLQLLGVSQDITAQKQTQGEMAQRAEELGRSKAELDRFGKGI